MAVDHPVAGPVRHELYIASLCNANQRGVSARPDRLRLAPSLASRFPKSESMQMNRMMVHAEIDDPDTDALTVLDDQRRGCRPCLPVECEPVELHVHAIGNLPICKHPIYPAPH